VNSNIVLLCKKMKTTEKSTLMGFRYFWKDFLAVLFASECLISIYCRINISVANQTLLQSQKLSYTENMERYFK
jgi:hypothetical protein